MSAGKDEYYDCPFVSIHYIICECGETFPSENGLKVHLEKEHPHKREKKEFKCGVCGSLFRTEDECITHYEDLHISGDTRPEEGSDDEIKTECVDYQEETVVEENNPIIELEESQEVQMMDGEVYNFPTSFGEVVQNAEGQLVIVVRNTQGSNKTLKKKRMPKDIVCEVCGKKYASNAALKYHQRVHTGERPYKCHMCPKSFTMPLFLQIHVRTHTGERPYSCPDCPKAFSNKAALLRHERVHTGAKPYACPLCQKTFTQSNSMKLHVSTVHLKQPAPYKSKNRKLRAAERRGRRAEPEGAEPGGAEPPRAEDVNFGIENETIVIKLESDPEEERESEGELVESEVVSDHAGAECYEIIYET